MTPKDNRPVDLSKLNFTVPIMATDGNIVQLTSENIPTLLFFQIRPQAGQGLEADVVAAVRLHSIEELKSLNKSITETIERHENREP
ncbi:MAG: hypothetical protein JWS12_738 [Candidatus Saccharibacteria bacterium]|nr:hypothetical protein [Candidatus Saccharibacteria bacterium]